MTSLRRGEAPILARYEGAYAATTLTVMGDRTGFVWKQPPTNGKIDELVAAKWKRMKIQPSDSLHRRRVSPPRLSRPDRPAAERREVRAFLADPRLARVKRDELVDKLIGGKDFVEYWTNKWADLLQVNRKFLGERGCGGLPQWIRKQVAANMPYDQFAQTILTASGSNSSNPRGLLFQGAPRRPRPRWRTRRSCSWACASIATSATIIRSSAGLRTSTTRRPRSSLRST